MATTKAQPRSIGQMLKEARVTARYTRSTREAMEQAVESLDYEDHDGEDGGAAA